MYFKQLMLVCSSLLLASCGGGGSSNSLCISDLFPDTEGQWRGELLRTASNCTGMLMDPASLSVEHQIVTECAVVDGAEKQQVTIFDQEALRYTGLSTGVVNDLDFTVLGTNQLDESVSVETSIQYFDVASSRADVVLTSKKVSDGVELCATEYQGQLRK